MVARILPFDGVLQVAQVGLRLPGIAEELQRQRGSQKPAPRPPSSQQHTAGKGPPQHLNQQLQRCSGLRAARALSIPHDGQNYVEVDPFCPSKTSPESS